MLHEFQDQSLYTYQDLYQELCADDSRLDRGSFRQEGREKYLLISVFTPR